jgi:hypothetical protein
MWQGPPHPQSADQRQHRNQAKRSTPTQNTTNVCTERHPGDGCDRPAKKHEGDGAPPNRRINQQARTGSSLGCKDCRGGHGQCANRQQPAKCRHQHAGRMQHGIPEHGQGQQPAPVHTAHDRSKERRAEAHQDGSRRDQLTGCRCGYFERRTDISQRAGTTMTPVPITKLPNRSGHKTGGTFLAAGATGAWSLAGCQREEHVHRSAPDLQRARIQDVGRRTLDEIHHVVEGGSEIEFVTLLLNISDMGRADAVFQA